MIGRRSLAIAVVVVALARVCFAGAWTQPRGGYYAKISGSYLYTEEELNYKGDRLDLFEEHPGFGDASFRDLGVAVYGEYGHTDRITLVAFLPFKALRAERVALLGGGLLRQREIRNTIGLGDLWLSVRTRLVTEPLIISMQTGLKVPLGYDDQPDNDGPRLGSGDFDGEIQLLAGKSLHPLDAYVSGGVGYRRRGGRLNDEVLYSIEGGYTRGPLLFKAGLDGLMNTKAPPDIYGATVVTPLPGGGGALPDLVVGDQDVLKVIAALIYTRRPGLSLQVELIHTLAGKNTLGGPQLSVGVVSTN